MLDQQTPAFRRAMPSTLTPALHQVYLFSPVLNAEEIQHLLARPEVSAHHDEDGGHHIRPDKATYLPWVAQLLWPSVCRVWGNGQSPFGVDQYMKLYRLEAGKGAVAPHRDEDFDGPHGSRARYSILLFLNDSYTGGETIFNLVQTVPHPPVGGGLIFPHSVLHEGRAVKSGTKYVLKTDLFVYDS